MGDTVKNVGRAIESMKKEFVNTVTSTVGISATVDTATTVIGYTF